MSEKRRWWIIHVAGYGAFAAYGLEAEVEETRAAKAEWEGGAGRKRVAAFADDDDARMVEAQMERWRRDLELGVELTESQREAIGG
ncbi:MAG TPA: hypothetical protein VM389_15235 [Phycisphaerae bacterium]|nr:hypothetical protein [Phycisphaerae bacterium]HUU60597.1 hypothetical protein [Phycisphaerae bacterium]